MAKKIKLCLHCGTKFPGRRDAKTCSARCRKGFQRTRLAIAAQAKEIGHEIKQEAVKAVEEGLNEFARSIQPLQPAYAEAETVEPEVITPPLLESDLTTPDELISDFAVTEPVPQTPRSVFSPSTEEELPIAEEEMEGLRPVSDYKSSDRGFTASLEEQTRRRTYGRLFTSALGVAALIVLLFGLGTNLFGQWSDKKDGGSSLDKGLSSVSLGNDANRNLHLNLDTIIDRSGKFTTTGLVLLKNQTNSAAAVVVQNSGGDNILVVDTINGQVGIGTAPDGPSALQVAGDITASGSLLADSGTQLSDAGLIIDSVLVCTSAGCNSNNTTIITGGSGDIEEVNAGAGLSGGGTSGAVTLTIGAGSGIDVGADSISIDVSTTATTGTISSNSGLEVSADGLRLLGGCADNEILKWDSILEAWACDTDNAGGGGANSFETINAPAGTDPVADSATDTLNLTVTGANLAITGTAGTDTLNFDITETALAGAGLAASGDALDIGAGNGITVNANDIAVRLDTTAADGSSTSSISGLEFVGGELSLIRGCAAGDLLKWDNVNFEWDCAADTDTDTDTQGNAFTTIDSPAGTDPTADTSTDTLQFAVTGSNLVITGANDPESLTFDINESVLAGSGLNSSGDALVVGTANGGIVINANDIALTLTTTGTAGATSSNSGLEILAGGLTILKGCADGETLKWNNTTDVWACATDNGAGASFVTIDTPAGTDPVADGSGDTLQLLASGTNITITGADNPESVTFNLDESVLAGAGLAANTDALDVGAGNGITVNTNDVAVNQDFDFTFTGNVTFTPAGTDDHTLNLDSDSLFALNQAFTGTATANSLTQTITNSSTSGTQNALYLDNAASTGTTESLLVIDNSDTDTAVTNAIEFIDAGGTFTNLFNVGGTLIATTEFTVLDAGIDESEVIGEIEAVTAGLGLINGGASGSVTLDVASANGGIVINANDIALTLTTTGTAGATSSNSGLEILAGGLTILKGCADGETLKWNNTTDVWACATDNGAGASFVTIDTPAGTDPVADGSGDTLQLLASGTNITITGADNPESVTFNLDESVLAGAGLAANTDALDVGAGNGITVNTNDVAVNQDFDFTFTGNVTFTPAGTDDHTLNLDSDSLFALNQAFTGTATANSLTQTITNSSTSGTQNALYLDNAASTGTTESLLVIDNSDTDTAVTNAIEFIDAGGTFTNLFNVGGTLIATTEFTVLDAGIDESEVIGEIEAVTAGLGLINGGASGSVTLDVASANGGIVINANDIALTLTTTGTAGATSSNSGLEILAGGLTILKGCADGETLKWNNTTDVWACATDNGAGASFVTIDTPAGTDPVADGSGDTLQLLASGTNITITGADNPESVTFNLDESVLAGAGLAANTDALDVGAGNGITVNTNDVAVNQDFDFTFTGNVTFTPAGTDDHTLNLDSDSLFALNQAFTGTATANSLTQTITNSSTSGTQNALYLDNAASTGTTESLLVIDNSDTDTAVTNAIEFIDAGGTFTNLFNVGGTLIATTEFTVLDAGIDESEVIGEIEAVTAGLGLINGGASGSVTLDVASANGGIVINANDIALTLTTTGTAGATSSNSGLEILAGGLTILKGCADGETLKWNNTTDVWACATDNGAGASFVTIDTPAGTDPVADGSGDTLQLLASGTNITITGADNPESVTFNLDESVLAGAGLAANTDALDVGAGNGITVNTNDVAVNQDFDFTFTGNVTFTPAGTDDHTLNLDSDSLFALNQAFTGTATANSLTQTITNSSTSGTQNALYLDNAASTGTTESLLVIDNSDTDTAVTNAIEFIDAGGTFTNLFNVGGTLIATTEFTVLDAGIDESEVIGEIEAVTAGLGLINGGASGSVTLDVASANGGIVINANDIALTLTTTGTAGATSSNSGLEILAGGLTILKGCADGETLKWNNTTDVWACATDNGAGASFVTIDTPAGTDPVADGSGDTLQLLASGTNITITGADNPESVTFNLDESVLAGAGLAANTDALDVGAGNGITVNTNDVAVNQDFDFTFTGNVTFTPAGTDDHTLNLDSDSLFALNQAFTGTATANSLTQTITNSSTSGTQNALYLDNAASTGTTESLLVIDNSDTDTAVTNAIEFIDAGGTFTNLFNVGGTLIATTEFTVLDAGIDESEVIGEIEAVTAGLGLINGGASGSVTLDVASANGGIVINANDIALTLTTTGTAGATSSNSGLEILAGGLTILKGCADGETLKWNNTTDVWACATDNGAGASFVTIDTPAGTDPVADGSGDTLQLLASGTNITITGADNPESVTFNLDESVLAGAGLAANTDALDVGAGNGITVNTNDVAVNQDFDFTFTGNVTFTPAGTDDHTLNLDSDSLFALNQAFTGTATANSLTQTITNSSTSGTQNALYLDNAASTGTTESMLVIDNSDTDTAVTNAIEFIDAGGTFTNLFNVGGTLIATTEFTVLDAGIDESEVIGEIEAVTAGLGLINGGASGSVTLDVASANGGIVINANDIALTLTTTGTAGATSSNSGLEILAGGLTILKGCADGETLKWNNTTDVWACATDNGAGASFVTIDTPAGTDPVADGSGDTLQLLASGTNITITGADNPESVTFNLDESVLAGAGLVASGDALDVGAGNGITVNTNDVAVNQDFDFTFTGNVTFTPAGTDDHTLNLDSDSLFALNQAFTGTATANSLTQTITNSSTSGTQNALYLDNAASTGTTESMLVIDNSDTDTAVTNAIEFIDAGGTFTNLFNVGGTLIATTEFTVLDAGIDESEVIGEIEAVTAGLGLINGGASGSVTLDVASANGGIVINANDIALTLTASGTAGATSSNSGLEILAGGLTILKGCADGETLKWNNTTDVWACATDNGAGASFVTIDTPAGTDPVADGSGDTLQLLASGTNITITGADNPESVTFNLDESVLAGAGLAANTDALDVGAGNGITVNTNDVAVNQDFDFTFTGNVTFTPAGTDDHTLNLDSDSLFALNQAFTGTATANSLTQTITNSSTSGTQNALYLDNAASTGTTESLLVIDNSDTDTAVTNAIEFIDAGGTFTNLFNVGGTLIATTEFTVLDAGIDESEVIGEIEAVTAGLGLINGGASGSVTLDVASANGGIVINANDIALTLQTSADGLSSTTSSGSGLEILAGGLTMLQGCADTQILSWNETSDVWGCSSASGFTTLQNAYDNDVDGSDTIITQTTTDDGLIFRNPDTSGSDSTYILTLDQLEDDTGTHGGLSIQSAGTGNLLLVTDTTATARDVLTIADGGATTFRNQANSAAAFQILNAAGTTSFLVDTTSGNVQTNTNGVGMLDVVTELQVRGKAAIGGTHLNSTVALTVSGASGQTANLLTIQTNTPTTVFSVGATGAVIAKTSTNSATAFQIQDSASTALVISDTTGATDGTANVLSVNVAPSSSSGVLNGLVVSQSASANTNALDASLYIDNADNNAVIGAAIQIANTGGGNYTNILDILGTGLSATELTVLDAGIDESEVIGEIEAVTAGLGLINGGASGSVTLDVASANGGIVINANDIALTLTASGTAGATSSNSGLEILAGGLTILKGCADGETLKWNNTTDVWACATDNGAGASFVTIDTPAGTDPVADGSGDTLQLLASGTNITITGADNPESVTFNLDESVLAGAGLAANGDALDVGTGNGAIDVGTNDITFDFNHSFPWTADHTWTLAGAEDLAVTHDLAGTINVFNIVGTPHASANTAQGLLIQQANSANGNGFDSALVIDNADTNLAIGTGIALTSSGGGFTTGISIGGATTDITTTGNETLTIAPAGTGDIVLTTTNTTTAIQLNVNGSGGDLDINVNDAITLDSASLSLDATTSSNLTVTGSGQSLTLAAAGGGAQEVIISSAGTGASALNFDSTGTGGGMTFNTTDGAIVITAAGASNGDITISPTDDFTLNGTAGSLINIGTSSVTQTITLGNATNTDLVLSDANWNVTGAGTATFADITCNSASCISTGEITDATITGDDIASSLAGAGLVLTAGSPDVLDIASGNAGIVVNANDITLDATVSGDALSATTSSGSGLEVVAGQGLTLLAGCSDTQVLQFDEDTDVWQCATASGGNSFTTIDTEDGTDPVADTSSDTLVMTSTGANLTITGADGPESVTFDLVEATLAGAGLVANGDAIDIASTNSAIDVGTNDITFDFNHSFPWTADHTWTLAGAEDLAVTHDLAGTINVVNIVGTPHASANTAQGLLIQQANSANGNGFDSALVIDNADTNLAIGTGIALTSSGGGFTAGLSIGGATTDITTTGTEELLIAPGSTGVLSLSTANTTAAALNIDATAGGIDIDAANSTITISNASNGAGDDLILEVTGANDASVVINSSGTSASDAIDFNATAGGITLDVLSALSFDVTAATAASNISVAANADAEDLTIEVTGSAGDLILSSPDQLTLTAAGGAANSLLITSTNGGIDITNAGAAAGDDIDINSTASLNLSSAEAVSDAVTINASAGGVTLDAVTALSIDVTAATAASNISVAANADAEDLTIAVTGSAGDLILSSADQITLDGVLLSLDATTSSNLTVTGSGQSLTLSAAGGGAQEVIINSAGTAATALNIDAAAGGIAIDVLTALSFDVTGATAASNISVVADADAEDLTIAVTGSAGDLFLNSVDQLTLDAGSATSIILADLITDANAVLYTSTTGVLTRVVETETGGQCLTSGAGASGIPVWGSCGGGGATLQTAYDADVDGSDAIITLSNEDDSIIISNPNDSANDTDSTFLFKVQQLLATGSQEGLVVESNGTGNLLRVTDTTATARDVLNIADGGATTLRNQTNSTAALQVQSSAAGVPVFTVDTTNSLTVARGINSVAVLGSNLLSGSSCSGTNWAGSGLGPYTHTTGSTVNLSCTPPASVTAASVYQVVFDVGGSPTSGESVTPNVGGTAGQKVGENETETQLITAAGTTNWTFTPTSNFNGTVTITSIQEVTSANSVLTIDNSDGVDGITIRSGGSGLGNTFIGIDSGRSVTTASENTAVGKDALQDLTTGIRNTAVGYEALAENTTGHDNTAIGRLALWLNTGGFENTALGSGALALNTQGSDNTAVGYGALNDNVHSDQNTALGAYAMNVAVTAGANTALGYASMEGLTDGDENVAVGANAGRGLTTGDANVAIGAEAGRAITIGNENVSIGYYSGYFDPDVPSFVTLPGLTRAISIGYGSQVQANSSLILGGQGGNAVKVGIGTTAPTDLFSVSPDFYDAGTASTSASATVVGVGTTWTSDMVGMEFIFANGNKYNITGFTDTTHLTLSASSTNTSQVYRIHNRAFYVTSTGSSAHRTSTNSATAFQVQNSGGTSLFTADTLANRLNLVLSSFSGNVISSTGATSQTTAVVTTTLDSTGDVGSFPYITIGNDGLPIISHHDFTNSFLKVTKCTVKDCSASTSTTISGSTPGRDTSIAIGSDGYPIISYRGGSDDLYVTKCGNADCTAGNVTTPLDTTGTTGYYSAIAVPADGLPFISYYFSSSDMKVLKCGNPACTSGNTLTAIDTTGDVGSFSDMVIGSDGLPIISYYDGSANFNLKTAKCTNATCTTPTITTLESTNDIGQYSSIAVGADGFPVISYYDVTNTGLRVAKCADLACTPGSATFTAVDTANDYGKWSSITVGTDGLPIVSYYHDDAADDLRVAKCTTPSCSASTITSVETTGVVGDSTEITIGTDGLPIIAHYKGTGGLDLMVTRCGNTSCSASGTTVTGGLDIGSMSVSFADAFINNINAGSNSGLTLTTNGITRLTVDSAGTSTFSGDIVTSNYGLNVTDSDTNPGCAAGEYKIYADTSETKLKKCMNGSASDLDTGGAGGTLQGSYDAGSAGDQVITLDATQDSVTISNPSSSGSDSTFVFQVEQLNTGIATDGMFVDNRGTGNGIRVDDSSGDTSPFIVDADGRVGIGTSSIIGSTERLLQVGSPTNRGNASVYGDIVSQGISDITGLTNIRDVYLYDTTADSDGGRWIDWATTDQLSWYTETLDDGASDPCVIATDDRCYAKGFPRKAILIVTTDALYIFDAATNDMWMKFSQDAAGWALGVDTNSDPSSVTAMNGVIYVGTNGSAPTGLYALDFVNDRMWNYDTTDRSGGDKGIGDRNTAITYNTENVTQLDIATVGTVADWLKINDVSVTNINSSITANTLGAATNGIAGYGKTFVGLATDSGVTIIDLTGQRLVQYSDNTDNDYTALHLTKRGYMYALNTAVDQLEKWTSYDSQKATQVNQAPTSFWDEATLPALSETTPNIIAGAPDALEVIERGSLADDISDIIYVGHSLGLTEIQDNTATKTSGWSKFYNTTRQTPFMTAGIKALLPMDNASGNVTDASYGTNTTDMTAKGTPTYGVPGVRGKAMSFNGTSQYLCSDTAVDGTCDNDTAFNMSTTGWTLSMWFKHAPTVTGTDVLFDKCFNATPAAAIGCVSVYMNSSGNIVAGVDDDASFTIGSVYDITSTSSHTYNDSQWHNIILSRTNAADVDVYVDGNAQNLSTGTALTLTFDGTQVIGIGADCSVGANCGTGANFWAGEIDDVSFTSGSASVATMTAANVRRLYNDARPTVNKRTITVTDATAATSTTLQETGSGWSPNEFAGLIMEITGSSDADCTGVTRRVTSNTTDTLTFSPAAPGACTMDTSADFEVDPEALYGASDAVWAVGITAEAPMGEARQMCVGTNNAGDAGGVTCYNHQAGPNIIADVFHSRSAQTDDFGVEWTGGDYDDIRSIDLSGRALIVGSEAHFYSETRDVRLGQGLDYLANQLFNIRSEILQDAITAVGSFGLEVGFTGGADLAERYTSSDELVAGNVVSLEPNQVGAVKKSTVRYEKGLVGIVSTAPGAVLGPDGDMSYPIALVGRVPVKVTTENGEIKAGDRVTSSSTDGYGMKAINAGRVLGTALDDLTEDKYTDCPEGTQEGVKCGEITVFVNLVDYNGEDTEIAMNNAEDSGMLWEDSFLSPIDGLLTLGETLSDELAAAKKAQLEKADRILRYLAGRQTGEDGSEVLADRVSAGEINGVNIHAGTVYAATLKVDKLHANQIAGLEVFTDKLASLASLNNNEQGDDSTSGSETGTTSQQFDFTNLEVETLAVEFDLNVDGGLTIGGPAEFRGSAFFRGLVTFVEKTIFRNDVTFAGHVLTDGEVPEVATEAAAGIKAVPVDDPGATLATATITGNDNSGKLEVKIGENSTAGELITLTFKQPFAKAPQVLLTATNGSSAQLKYYVEATTDGFKIIISDPQTVGTTLKFNYWVVQ